MSSDLSVRKRALGLDAIFDRLGPAAKLRDLSMVATPFTLIKRYLNTGDQLNILRQVQDIQSSVASGVQ